MSIFTTQNIHKNLQVRLIYFSKLDDYSFKH